MDESGLAVRVRPDASNIMTTTNRTQAGYTLADLLLVAATATTLTGMALPLSATTIDHVRTAAAARYVAARVAALRIDAVRRSATTALRFERSGPDYTLAAFVDGNGNGLRAADVAKGIDRALDTPERLDSRFQGTGFGLRDGVPDLDGGVGNPDGVRIGASKFLSFAPDGGSTSGTLYVTGRRGQYAVRVLGATGRVRLFVYDAGGKRWLPR
jgi:hypothetical protein